MDSGQCRRCALLEQVTQILCLLTWLEPESAQALTWYLCFTLFECLDPDLPFFCICSPHCRRHLDEQIMALLRITIRATVRVVEADRTFSARPLFYFRLGNTLAVLQTSTSTMHSAGSQLPRRPCPAVRPTTTQGSTMTGVRATPAAALCETPGIAPQSAPPPLPMPHRPHRSRRHRHPGGLDAALVRPGTDFNRSCLSPRHPRPPFPSGQRTPAVREPNRHQFALPHPPLFPSGQCTPPFREPNRHQFALPHPPLFPSGQCTPPFRERNRHQFAPPNPPLFPSGQCTASVREPNRHQFAPANPPPFPPGQCTPTVREPNRHQFAPANPPLFPSGQRTPTVREPNRHQSAPPNPADSLDGPDPRLQRPFAELAAGRVTVGLVWFEN